MSKPFQIGLNCLIITAFLMTSSFVMTTIIEQSNNISSEEATGTPGAVTTTTVQETDPAKSPYTFTDSAMAYQILTKLDVFVPVDNSYLGYVKRPQAWYDRTFFGIGNDDKYCEKHRALFVEHPEMIFNQQNLILESRKSTLVSAVEQINGTDIMPFIGTVMPRALRNQTLYDLRLDVNVFYTAHSLHKIKHLGLNYGCLTQEVNHVPGHYGLKMRDLVVRSTINYAKKFEDRPHCFNYSKYFLETWILHDKASCQEFFARLKTPEHKALLKEKQIVYISKEVNTHKGKGVLPLNAKKELALRKKYKDGELCGQVYDPMIVQPYVANGLLLEGRKFDFRMYMLVASTDPLMVFYHDGLIRISLFEFDVNSTNNKVHLTNLALNKKIHQAAREGNYFKGMDEMTLKHFQQWNFERLIKYLLDEGIVTDPNWLDNYLRPEMKKAMTHLIRMSSDSFLRRSSIYGLYGVDFMIDTDFQIWFMEANAGPAFGGFSEVMEKYLARMLRDHFEVVYGILRSRTKRIVNLINKIIESGDVKVNSKGEYTLKSMYKWKKLLEEASKNRFEPEFEPSKENGFSKFIDENYAGVKRFGGFVDETCLKL